MREALPPTRPLTIAHRAGNDLSRLEEAFEAGADYAEADVWLHRGRLEVRHDKTAGPLPILWERWSLKPGWTSRLNFGELLTAASGRGRLLADLKGRENGLAEALGVAVERAAAENAVAFCGGWSHLDRLAEMLPQAPLFYTVGDLQRLAALRPRLDRRDISGVSIDSRILTGDIVSELKGSGVREIMTWAVETPAAARRVLAWGVTGVTSDSLALLKAIRDGRVGPAAG
jgi:glycerophosphoryl diester phosphodiesterase